MNTNVSFRHMESSPALREYAVNKLERVVGKYVHGRINASVVMSVEKFRHIVNFTVQIKNLTVKSDSSSEDMYSSIDLALDKIERQLRRHKDRLRGHKPTHGKRGKPFRMSVLAPPLEDEADDLDVDGFDDDIYPPSEVYESEAVAAAVEAPPAPAEPQVEEEAAAEPEEQEATETVTTPDGDVPVLRTQNYEALAMGLDEAILQLQLLDDREFFVFTNAETHDINIVYKRADGKFGLIET